MALWAKKTAQNPSQTRFLGLRNQVLVHGSNFGEIDFLLPRTALAALAHPLGEGPAEANFQESVQIAYLDRFC